MSYDPTLATALDRVRHALGDTGTPPLRTDDTIEAVLLLAGTTADAETVTLAEKTAIAELASALAVEYAQRPDSVDISGKIAISWRERVKAWQVLATRLYAEVAAASAAVASAATGGAQSVAAVRVDGDAHSEYYREPSGYGRNWFTE